MIILKFFKSIATGLILTSAFVLGGCGVNDDSKQLLLFNWGEYINPEVLNMFTEETGIQVVMDTFESNESMYTRVAHGNFRYDIIIPSDYMIYRMIQEEMLQPINLDNIYNFNNLDEQFLNLEFDPNNKFSVPYLWGTVGILYNTTMVNTPVDSWSILWNEDYSGQIFMYDSERDSMAVALKKLGYSLNTSNEDEINAARDLLIAQRPLVKAYVTDQVRDFMIGGEGALSVVYSGDAVFAMLQNPDLNFVIPREGSNLWVDSMVIPATSTRVEEAEKFINFMLRPDIAALNSNYIGFSTPNRLALEMGLINDELINNSAFSITPEEYKKLEVFLDLGENRDIYTRAWTAVLATR